MERIAEALEDLIMDGRDIHGTRRRGRKAQGNKRQMSRSGL